METELLQTKLLAPLARPDLIPRPHLIARLNAGLNHRLTLISAPAGFGKTTLATDWLPQVDRPSVWVSLDSDDNDLIQFFTYAVAAVRQIEGVGTGMQRLLQSPHPPPLKALATAFLNDCTTASTPFLLVFDDYHVINEPAVHEAVTFLLDHLLSQLHLVITSRTDPLLPLPRLRARGQLTELRTQDLRFSVEEAADFLQQSMGLDLSAEQVSALEARTEGWIAGLQMAALSLQGLDSAEEVNTFVTDFSGSHRYIFDYLTDEVLQQRPAQTQAFLLQTSLLDRFNASLCSIVTGQPDCETTLGSLERANLFLFPLDEQRHWYRYHHLFAELLRRLQRSQPDLVPALYRRAGAWFAARGEVDAAVKYALAGDDAGMAAEWLDAVALDFVARSHVRQLLALAAKLPLAAQIPHVRLCLALAWAHIFNADLDRAEIYVARSRSALAQPAAPVAVDFPSVLANAYLATIEAFIATRRAQPVQAVARSRQALDLLDSLPQTQARTLRGSILINLGQSLTILNQVAEAEAAFRQAIRHTKAVGRIFGVMAASANMAKLQRKCGHLAAAKLSGRQALAWLVGHRQDDTAFPAEGEVRLEMALVCYERNQLDEARHHVEMGLDLYRHISTTSTASCLHMLFKLELAAGHVEDAVDIHGQIETLLSNMTAAFSYPVHDARRADRIRRLRQALSNDVQWEVSLRRWATMAERDKRIVDANINSDESTFLRACVAAALGDHSAALQILDRLATAAQAARLDGDLVQYRVQQALVLDQMGERIEATTHLAVRCGWPKLRAICAPFSTTAARCSPCCSRCRCLPTVTCCWGRSCTRWVARRRTCSRPRRLWRSSNR